MRTASTATTRPGAMNFKISTYGATSAPSGPRGWVVLSELRWVPCLGSPSPVSGPPRNRRFRGALLRAFGRRPDSEVPKCCLLGNAHIARNPSGANQYYVDGLGGGTT